MHAQIEEYIFLYHLHLVNSENVKVPSYQFPPLLIPSMYEKE